MTPERSARYIWCQKRDTVWLFKPVSILVPKIINERPNKHNPTQPTESTPLLWTSDRAATGDMVVTGPLRAVGPLDVLKGQEYCMMRQDCRVVI